MKMILKRAQNNIKLIEEKEYSLRPTFSDLYYEVDVDGQSYTLHIEQFESPIERFKRISVTAKKVLIPRISGNQVHVLMTESYIIFYSHTPGNHYNICGNHYKYYHDINTGEFIPEHLCNAKESIIMKERLLKAKAIELDKINKG